VIRPSRPRPGADAAPARQEWNRNGTDVKAPQRALREIYLRGFETVVREAKPSRSSATRPTG
jgi:hypothetical protein